MLGEFEAFRIDIVPTSCEVNVVVAGDIDVATAHDLHEHLQAVERSSRDVVIDLSDVAFIDAAALRVLIRSQRRLQATGRSLTVRNASRIPSRVLRLAGLDDIIDGELTAGGPAAG